jgi:formate dehydrogenase subunit delta
MSVKADKLLRMGEQIRDNMNYIDDRDLVAQRIADHLSRFWDPRMLEVIKALQVEQPDEFSAELSAAVQLISPPQGNTPDTLNH